MPDGIYGAITPEYAGRTPENYILPQVGLDLGQAAVTRPPLEQPGEVAGIDEYAGPLQPAWGWYNKVDPQAGESPEEFLTAQRVNPVDSTFNMRQDARQSIALEAFGKMQPSGVDAGDPTRGSWLEYQPVPYVALTGM